MTPAVSRIVERMAEAEPARIVRVAEPAQAPEKVPGTFSGAVTERVPGTVLEKVPGTLLSR